MLILGLVLVVAGALLIVGAVATASGEVDLLGTEIGALTVFLLGVASGVAILLGLAVAKYGTKRALAQRRERARLEQLSRKLEEVEHERRHGEGADHRADS